ADGSVPVLRRGRDGAGAPRIAVRRRGFRLSSRPVIRSGDMFGHRRRSTIAVALSATSVALFATVASVPASPFQPLLPAGIEPTGPFRWLAGALGVDALHGAVLAALGVVTAAFAAA